MPDEWTLACVLCRALVFSGLFFFTLHIIRLFTQNTMRALNPFRTGTVPYTVQWES